MAFTAIVPNFFKVLFHRSAVIIRRAKRSSMSQAAIDQASRADHVDPNKRVGRDAVRPVSFYIGTEVTAVVCFSKGFAAAYGVGNVIVYEEQLVFETAEDHYKQIYVIKIPPDTSESEDRIIKTLTINPAEELLLATTFNNQIFMFSLGSAELKVGCRCHLKYYECPCFSLTFVFSKGLG